MEAKFHEIEFLFLLQDPIFSTWIFESFCSQSLLLVLCRLVTHALLCCDCILAKSIPFLQQCCVPLLWCYMVDIKSSQIWCNDEAAAACSFGITTLCDASTTHSSLQTHLQCTTQRKFNRQMEMETSRLELWLCGKRQCLKYMSNPEPNLADLKWKH